MLKDSLLYYRYNIYFIINILFILIIIKNQIKFFLLKDLY